MARILPAGVLALLLIPFHASFAEATPPGTAPAAGSATNVSTANVPNGFDIDGEAIPWRIDLETQDDGNQPLETTTLAEFHPHGDLAELRPRKLASPKTFEVPAGATSGTISIWCFGGDAYGTIHDLSLERIR